MNLLLTVFEISIIELLYFSGLLIILGLAIGFLQKKTSENIQRVFGWKGILATAWIGTPIHELGHAFMCIIFRHKITQIKLLDLHSKNGTLGYVSHTYNKNNIYQRIGNLFIGIGPFFSGIAVLLLSLNFLLPNSLQVFEKFLTAGIKRETLDLSLINWCFTASFNLIINIFSFSNFTKVNFWVFLILAFSICTHMALSKPDIKGAFDGFVTIFILIFVLNFIAKLLSINTYSFILKVERLNTYFSALLIMAFIFSVITFCISFVLYSIKKAI